MPLAVTHQYIPLSASVTLHALCCSSPTQPPRGTCVMVHGFPDTCWGWRHQIRPVALAGFDVVVPDMRGYGHTAFRPSPARPWIHEDFSQEQVCADLLSLLDALLLDRAVFCGHDWGGTIVWNLALHYPARVQAVASFCTPFFQPNPASNPWPKMLANPGRFEYQLYFQTEQAVREFDADPRRTVRCMIRSATEPLSSEALEGLMEPRKAAGGMLRGFPAAASAAASPLMTLADENVYTSQFARSSFRGGIYYYRNVERNWAWNCSASGRGISQPALMVTAELDAILTPSMTKGMAKHIPRLEEAHVAGAGHFVLQEKPEECAALLVAWLGRSAQHKL